MAITLNHTIVPTQDKVASAEFFARVFGVPFEGVRGISDDMQVNTRRGGRGFYFLDPNGHSLELLTRT